MKNYNLQSIVYLGFKLQLPEFLIEDWPFKFPLKEWPTFCGAGSGFGDKIVPDRIYGIDVSPACYLHDIGWAICDNTYSDFKAVNKQFKNNLISIIDNQLSGLLKYAAKVRCYGYYWTVSSIGWRYFKRDDVDKMVCKDPAIHPVVLERKGVLNKAVCKYFELLNK